MADPLPMWGHDPDREPSITKGGRGDSFVAPNLSRRQQFQAPVLDAERVDISGVWAVRSATVEEIGKPQDRAWATLIRASPIVLFLALLGVPMTWVVLGGWDWIWGIAIIGSMALVGILAVTLVDLQWNSPSSTEIRRVDRAYQLKRMELEQNHELKRDIVNAWLKSQEGRE